MDFVENYRTFDKYYQKANNYNKYDKTFGKWKRYHQDRFLKTNYVLLQYEKMISFHSEKTYPVSIVSPNNLHQPEMINDNSVVDNNW